MTGDSGGMKTLDLKDAAALLHLHPVTLLRKAQRAEIPGAKPGKCWVFLEVDLIAYLRSHYVRRASNDSEQEKPWLSIDVKDRRSGGSILRHHQDDEYAKALGLPVKRKPRNTTTA